LLAGKIVKTKGRVNLWQGKKYWGHTNRGEYYTNDQTTNGVQERRIKIKTGRG